MTIESKLENLEPLSHAVRGICTAVIKDEVLIYQLILCLREAVTNVIIHGYDRNPDHFVGIQISCDTHFITFDIVDSSEKASLLKSRLELNDSLNDASESGMGLFLISHLMDKVSYHINGEGKNVLTMKKRVKS